MRRTFRLENALEYDWRDFRRDYVDRTADLQCDVHSQTVQGKAFVVLLRPAVVAVGGYSDCLVRKTHCGTDLVSMLTAWPGGSIRLHATLPQQLRIVEIEKFIAIIHEVVSITNGTRIVADVADFFASFAG